MRYLDAEEILLIHYQLVERYGGSHGTRDLARVRSVAVAPAQEVLGAQQYPTVFDKAAVYARNIIADHPFYDGNKRTGITAAAMFLNKNGHELHVDKGELEDFAVQIATAKLEAPAIAAWLKSHSNPA